MADYQLTATDVVIRTEDGANIPNDPANRDRVEYNEWLAAGGVPDPYIPPDPPPEPPPEEATVVAYGGAINYMFNLTVTPPPAAGGVRLNNAAQNLATQIFLSYTTNDSIPVNLKTFFHQRVEVGDTFYIQDKDAIDKWQLFELIAPPLDKGTYAELPVKWLNGGGSLGAARVVVARQTKSVISATAEVSARIDAGIAVALADVIAVRDAIHLIPHSGAVPARFEQLLVQMNSLSDALVAMLQAQQTPP